MGSQQIQGSGAQGTYKKKWPGRKVAFNKMAANLKLI